MAHYRYISPKLRYIADSWINSHPTRFNLLHDYGSHDFYDLLPWG